MTVLFVTFSKRGKSMRLGRLSIALVAAVTLQVTVSAAPISHIPADEVPPVVVSPAFGPLAAGGTVGANYIAYGVDYTFGGVEGIFSDPPLAFGGVNGSNNLDLVSPVDGRIVVLNSLVQGLTNRIFVEAGFADPGSLLLEVFDIDGNLLDSEVNGLPLGPNGRTTFEIIRANFDIASFRVSGNDTFGVNFVEIEEPQAVPEPMTLAVFGLMGLVGAGYGLRRRRKV